MYRNTLVFKLTFLIGFLVVGVIIGYIVANTTTHWSTMLKEQQLVKAVSGLGVVGVQAADNSKPSPQAANYSRTGAFKNRNVYYPGTEDLDPDEMRVITCGSGMPVPSLNQGAACFLVELGNGDKFIFDMGTGSSERLMSLGIPLDYINKVFIGHLHMDHMGDLPAFWVYGPQNNRSGPLYVWGPGGGGTRPEWGFKAAMENMKEMWAWMTGTLVGTIDTRSHQLYVTEFDWSKVNNVIYEENGVVIRTIPAIHFEQSVSFILEWNGLKFSFSSDTVPNKWWVKYTQDSDLSIHEAFFPTGMWEEKYGFSAQEALNASTVIHTSAVMFGKVMSLTKPRQAVAYHFTSEPDSLPQMVAAVRETYDGPVDYATDFMVWNVTKDKIRTRVGAYNKFVYPVPPLQEKQIAASGDRYVAPQWVTNGIEPELLPVIQKIYDDFNKEHGTDYQYPVKIEKENE